MQNSSQMYFTAFGGSKCEVGFTPMASNSVRLVTSQRENVRLDTPASLANFCLLIAFITCFFYFYNVLSFWLEPKERTKEKFKS